MVPDIYYITLTKFFTLTVYSFYIIRASGIEAYLKGKRSELHGVNSTFKNTPYHLYEKAPRAKHTPTLVLILHKVNHYLHL